MNVDRIQSGAVLSLGILQGLCGTGVVTFGAAISIILGQNIGTCITAIMGAFGVNRNARRTAIVHVTAVLMPMNGPLVKLACLFIPKEQESQKMELEDQLEAHEYLNALMAGELYESAAFTERFARYKSKYAFPEENENEIRRLDRRIFAFISAAVR